ncbi:hypothetical protein MRB53_038382 [Persea americana]|nr:hypothetical protein MRB53_038382 [Persea americana]
MQNHLLEKNVAREAAERLCQSVEADLLNQKTASFTSIDRTIRESMSKALTRILTPTSSLDLLRNINLAISGSRPRPYVISIVGVNGVGKSTNLSKIAYFLLQNNFRVLVVAADTFRSGAVEQLRVHVRNLTELSRRENVGHVELFEKGYGKDAATVARDAVTFATNSGKGEMLFDVVLIDTAGRRHNDSRLMSSLTKFGQLANPDKIFMVGEALVGTDSVAQARNFAKEFVDTKGQMRNGGVGMDGFIISKCDTVGDMVGTLVSMVHATGPITEMNQYIASVPADGQVRAEIRSFYERFYQISDDPSDHAKYAEYFTKNAKLIVGSAEKTGRDGRCALLSQDSRGEQGADREWQRSYN